MTLHIRRSLAGLLAAAQSSTFVIPFTTTVVNPCTAQTVTIGGSSTVTISENVTGSGILNIDVGVVTKGIGIAVATKYTLSESSQFSLKVNPNEEVQSDFTDKWMLKGAKSVDNWTHKIRLHITINALGEVTSLTQTDNGDVCNG